MDGRKTGSLLLIASGAAYGLTYGLAVRYGARVFGQSSWFVIMTLAFMQFLPFAMGFVTVFVIEWRRPQRAWAWFLMPWIPVVAGELTTMAALWEGFICVVMFTAIALGASSLGGAAAGLIVRHVGSRRSKQASLACVLCLPLLMSPVESRFLEHWTSTSPSAASSSTCCTASMLWNRCRMVRHGCILLAATVCRPISIGMPIFGPMPPCATCNAESCL